MLARLTAVSSAQPALTQLREWIGIAWACHRRGREYHRVVTYCHRDDFRGGLAAATREALDRIEQAFYDPLSDLLGRAVAEGSITPGPVRRRLNLLRAAFDGGEMLLWHPCLGEEDPDRFIEDYTAFMLAGLKAALGRAGSAGPTP